MDWQDEITAFNLQWNGEYCAERCYGGASVFDSEKKHVAWAGPNDKFLTLKEVTKHLQEEGAAR